MVRWLPHRVLAAVALAAVAVTTAPAVADPPAEIRHAGSCGLDSVMEPALGDGVFRGVVFAEVVAFSTAPERNPVTVTGLRCELSVNGEPRQSWTGQVAGPAGLLAPTPVEITAADNDVIDLCTVLDTRDATGAAASETYCRSGASRCPPEGYCGYDWVFDLVFGVLNDAFAVVDPPVCAVLAGLAPLDAGPLRIEPGGDTYVAGELFYDCPPYAS
jgi:hypothetical protein